MEQEIKQAAAELLALAMDLNAPDYHVWANFTGHVCWFEMRVRRGGWTKGGDDDLTTYIHLDLNDAAESLCTLRSVLLDDHREFREEQQSMPIFLRRQAD